MRTRHVKWMLAGLAVAIAVGATMAALLLLKPESAPAILPAKGQAGQTARARVLAEPLGRFGFSLLLKEAEAGEGNIVVSPASIQAALSMLASGARGETLAELRRALQLEGIDQQTVNQAWANLIAGAQAGKKSILAIADSLWLRNGVDFDRRFIDINRDYFAARLQQLENDPQAAADAINRWVAENTRGRITQIVGSIDPTALLTLVNTVYLKVSWSYFDRQDTHAEAFHLDGGKSVNVQTMSGHVEAPVVVGDEYDAVLLKTHGQIDTWIVVPKGDRSPESVIRALQPTGMTGLYAAASVREGDVRVPRLSLEYEAKGLQVDLQAMGVRRLFQPSRSQLQGIANVEPLYVQGIVHKATLDLNEEGVEAAAATGVVVGTTAMPVDQPFTIRADRPFMVVLTERASRAPLFMAVVRDPR